MPQWRRASLALVARREEALAAIAALCGEHALPIAADVSRRAEVRRVVDATLARHDRIDVWVNTVGQGITRPPAQLTDEDIDDMMRINVNVSSMLGRVPFAVARSAYNGAKIFDDLTGVRPGAPTCQVIQDLR
ncbi:MAG: SDR family NAD(P)-dependent oxidoreductase [Thermoflexales bacterium]